jgi:hypothetical protein
MGGFEDPSVIPSLPCTIKNKQNLYTSFEMSMLAKVSIRASKAA